MPCLLHNKTPCAKPPLSNTVTPAVFLQFLAVMSKRLKSEKWCSQLPSPGDSKNSEEAAERVELKLVEFYQSLWVSLGVVAEAGLQVQMKPALLLEQGGNESELTAVVSALQEFTDLEAETVRRIALGPKQYARATERQQEMERRMAAAHQELTDKLQTIPVEDHHKHIAGLQEQEKAITGKLRALPSHEVPEYLANLPAEEQMVLMQMQILRQTLGQFQPPQ